MNFIFFIGEIKLFGYKCNLEQKNKYIHIKMILKLQFYRPREKEPIATVRTKKYHTICYSYLLFSKKKNTELGHMCF